MDESPELREPTEAERAAARAREDRLDRLADLTDDVADEDLERVIGTGRAIVRLGRIGAAFRAAGVFAARREPDPATETPDLEAVRTRLALELTAVAGVGLEEELDAHTVLALVDAYRGLGGDLAIPQPPAPRRINPDDVKLVEVVRSAAWHAAAALSMPTSACDDVAAKVSEALKDAAL